MGIEMATGRSPDIAVNHDPQAIRMHRTNHPNTLHLTEDIFKVDIEKYVAGRHVDLMWASPDCTSHSKAKGGKPREQGLRILPWAVFKHAKANLPDVVIMENVEEIQQWGPLDSAGHPIKERTGEDYRKFIAAMKGIGYTYSSRELVAADYGAPTTRKRWYAIFRHDGRQIVWPKQTHSKGGVVPGTKYWEPVWKCLDLMDLGKSIFGRKKPLAEKTMKRIAAGLNKFVFGSAEPFIVVVNHGGNGFRGQSLNTPLQTITSHNGYGTVTPILVPFIDKAYEGDYKSCDSRVTDQVGTITTVDHNRLVTPLLIQYHSETSRSTRGQAVTEPVRTIDASNRYAMVSAFLTKFYKSGTGQSMWEPLHTITTSPGHFGQVSILAVDWRHLQEAGVDEEIVQKCTWVSQYIMEYYGCGTGQGLKEPLHTIVSKERFALITVLGREYCIMDIFLRMLNPEELKRAQGFPKDYIIDRDYRWERYPVSEQVKRIGNSVVPVMAEALVSANCPYLKVGERKPSPVIYWKGNQMAFA